MLSENVDDLEIYETPEGKVNQWDSTFRSKFSCGNGSEKLCYDR